MNDDLQTLVSVIEVYKLLEYHGIYPKFKCIKCKNVFGSVNHALQHLRGVSPECIVSKNYIPKVEPPNKDQIKKEQIKEIKEFTPRKEYTKKPKVTKQQYLKNLSKINYPKFRAKRSHFSEEDKNYIITTPQNNTYLAKRFNTTSLNISRLKYNWKKKLKPSELKELKESRVTKDFKYQKNASKDYKVEPADER